MASGFKIDRQGVAKMMQEIQQEFDKHRITVPVDAVQGSGPEALTSSVTHTYNGPIVVVNGDHAQLAWDNQTVTQNQNQGAIAPGFEQVATALVELLKRLPEMGLDSDSREDVEVSANEALAEVTKPEPNKGKIRRALASIRGMLDTASTGVQVAVEARELIKSGIEILSSLTF